MKVHSRRKSKRTYTLRILVFIICILLVASFLPAVFTTVSRIALYPFYTTQNWLRDSTSSLPSYLRDKGELVQEIETLERELAIAASTDQTQQRLYEENNRLRQLLGSDTGSRIAAAVVARPNELPYDYVQIDKGSEDGVEVGAPVYVGLDRVIGLVAYTDSRFSLVELFSTPGFRATAFVSGPDIVATLEGIGGGVARVLVPQGIPLAIGNLVYVPSIEPGVFGRVAFIENEPTQPEQYGYITLGKPIQSVHYVAVGSDPLVLPDQETVTDRIDTIMRQNLIIEGVNTAMVGTSTETTDNPSDVLNVEQSEVMETDVTDEDDT